MFNAETKRSYIYLHTAILLFGFTAILGEIISLKALVLVWHRLWITVLPLVFIPAVIRSIRKLSSKERWRFMGIGLITSAHWVAFYGSVDLSNASVTLSCMATSSLFTSFIEPFFFKKKVDALEIVVGVVVCLGMLLIMQASTGYMAGIIVGLIAAFLAALFSTLNKKYMHDDKPLAMTVLELGTGFLVLSLIVPFYVYQTGNAIWPTPQDWPYLLILSTVCTTLAYVLALLALKHITAFTANLSINLEPVYGIALAALLLKQYEDMNTNFYIGTLIVLSGVFSYPILKKVRARSQKKNLKEI